MRVILIAALTTAAAVGASAQNYGAFIGDVVSKWLIDDVTMELLEDFAYVDPKGKRWKAPKGSIINGASIPSIFWTPVGSPYTGPYRKASVVHDVACDTKTDTWQDSHRMFYYAMLAGGVSDEKAL